MIDIKIGDEVATNGTLFRALVLEVQETVSEFTGEPITQIRAVWLENGRSGGEVARKGRTRSFVFDKYGMGDCHKIG